MNEQYINEIYEICDLLIDKFKCFESEYGVRKIIQEFYLFRSEYVGKLRSYNGDIESIKKEFNEKLKEYIGVFNRRFGDEYEVEEYFYITHESIEDKYNKTVNNLNELKDKFIPYSKRNPEIYKYVRLASSEIKTIENDLSSLKDKYNELSNSLYRLSSTYHFVIGIPDISFIKKWHDYVNKCNSYIRTHKNEFDRVRFASI